MDPAWQALFFGLAVALFVVAVIVAAVAAATPRINWIAAGLACFVFPFFWIALKAA